MRVKSSSTTTTIVTFQRRNNNRANASSWAGAAWWSAVVHYVMCSLCDFMCKWTLILATSRLHTSSDLSSRPCVTRCCMGGLRSSTSRRRENWKLIFFWSAETERIKSKPLTGFKLFLTTRLLNENWQAEFDPVTASKNKSFAWLFGQHQRRLWRNRPFFLIFWKQNQRIQSTEFD